MPLLPLLLVYGLRLCLAGAAAPPPADPAALIRTLSDPAWSPPAFPNALKRVRAHMAQFRSYVARHVRRFDEGSVSGDPWQTEFYARVGWHFPAPAGRGPVVCETGFNMGMSTVLWLTACDNCTVHSFDLCDRAGGQIGHRRLLRLYPGRLTLHCGNTTQTLPRLVANSTATGGLQCDILHIDGGHEYDAVASDFAHFQALAAPAGHVLLLDDTNCDIFFCHGPNRAAWLAARRGLLRPLYRHRLNAVKGFTAGAFARAGAPADLLGAAPCALFLGNGSAVDQPTALQLGCGKEYEEWRRANGVSDAAAPRHHRRRYQHHQH